jgi:hypothetical protein
MQNDLKIIKIRMLEALKNNNQFDFDRQLMMNDAFSYEITKIIVPLNLFSTIQAWEGFYINNNDYYYKSHRLEIEEVD